MQSIEKTLKILTGQYMLMIGTDFDPNEVLDILNRSYP